MDHPLYLALVIATMTLFGCVLGFASFEETRARRKSQKKAVASPKRETASSNIVSLAK